MNEYNTSYSNREHRNIHYCNHCSASSWYEASMQNHVDAKHSGSPVVTKSSPGFTTEISPSSKTIIYTCSLCPKRHYSIVSMETHIKGAHKTVDVPLGVAPVPESLYSENELLGLVGTPMALPQVKEHVTQYTTVPAAEVYGIPGNSTKSDEYRRIYEMYVRNSTRGARRA